VCFKNSKDEKLDNGAMVGEEFEQENLPQFLKIAKENPDAKWTWKYHSFVFSLSRFAPGHEQQDGLP